MTRIIFMGSPQAAVPSLKALVEAGYEIPLVVTQPDRPKGRGQQIAAPPVKSTAEKLGLSIAQPVDVKDGSFIKELKALNPDFIAVVAYGKILPLEILKLPPMGCINLHFSILPKYRGAACVAYALINGEEETGVTTMLMDEGLDTGPILMQWSESVLPEDTCESLTQRLSHLGSQQLTKTIAALREETLQPVQQNESLSSYAPLLKKQVGHVDWYQGADKIYCLYQGLTPWPGLYSFLGKRRLLLSQIQLAPGEAQGPPGTLQKDAKKLFVNCKQGRIQLLQVKPEGKKVMGAQEFMNGLSLDKEITLS